jgi:hypothetical protein
LVRNQGRARKQDAVEVLRLRRDQPLVGGATASASALLRRRALRILSPPQAGTVVLARLRWRRERFDTASPASEDGALVRARFELTCPRSRACAATLRRSLRRSGLRWQTLNDFGDAANDVVQLERTKLAISPFLELRTDSDFATKTADSAPISNSDIVNATRGRPTDGSGLRRNLPPARGGAHDESQSNTS